ncbi:MAG: TonB-dependent receptor [Tannerellaceae bacterium]|jgi:TonB-linked SusC/RagA family outer membrane protein|nr:TonB-dependent receptor [Tannerellaceae bacterium]
MSKTILNKKIKLWKSLALAVAFLLFGTHAAWSQSGAVSGTVTDTSGEPLIGVNVIIKGTANGAITDIDGKYSLQQVSPQSVLVFSYVGYLSREVTVGNQRTINIQLSEDSQSLEEVVVVGYGVQKKKLVTGATIQVSGENLQKLSTTNAFTALQNQTPGVNILQNNGQPGAGYIINIRGIGTNGNSKPLYVVDGVPSGDDALNHMSSADIESIDILKDAASSAIYGARAANGVVLITTKQGKAGKTRLTYDGYYGRQYLSRKPDMLTAKEYMQMQDEMNFNDNVAPIDWPNVLPSKLYDDIMSGAWQGTDWVDAFYNEGAETMNHSFNLTGGNDVSKFSMGYSFTKQDGIFGENVQSHYDRHTFRINSDHVLLKVRDFEAIKIGQTLNYTYRTNNGISQGNIYWNAFHNVLVANPLMPAYDAEGNYYDYYDKQDDGWTFDGNFGNPIAAVNHNTQGLNKSKNHNLNTSVYLQIQPIKNLIFKSQFGYRMSSSSYRDQNQKIRLSNNMNTTTESIGQSQSVGYNWTLDNTLTYSLRINEHSADIQLGQAAEKWGYGESVGSGGQNNIFDLGWDYAWVNNTKPTQLSERSASGSPWGIGGLASFWGRINYNYKETYMATIIMRTDGSSNFARGHRWGTFPSVSAGWVVSNEGFMDGLKGKLDFLKLRANWGQNGNQSIGGFQYLTRYEFPALAVYYFGDKKNVQSTGAVAGVLKNPDVTWETSEQIDLGFDARFLNSRLGVTFDYYIKTTKDWLLTAPISATWGFSAPSVNGGAVQNKGVELAFTWNDRLNKDFDYGINLNGSYNKNEVTEIANTEGIIHGSGDVLSQGTSEFVRLQVGYPMGFFYGYKADGIFQNWNEVNAYTKDGNPIIPGAQPGDIRFRDINEDGKIDEEDKTMIGCGWPKYKAGFTVNLGYKGFDFMITASGAFGMQIAKSYRRFVDARYENFSTDWFGRWTGEGTSDKWPRLTTGTHINYQNVSDIFIEKGDYVKIQNITLGYDFKKLLPKMPLGQARVYVTAQNMFTFTGYSGMDPEVGFGDGQSWVTGIDLGAYPASKTYLVGVNLSF